MSRISAAPSGRRSTRTMATLSVEALAVSWPAKVGGRPVSAMTAALSSPELEAAVVDGVRDCGLEVWRVGLGPILYFATLTKGAAGGIMVTGTHNPPDQNGFKMMRYLWS